MFPLNFKRDEILHLLNLSILLKAVTDFKRLVKKWAKNHFLFGRCELLKVSKSARSQIPESSCFHVVKVSNLDVRGDSGSPLLAVSSNRDHSFSSCAEFSKKLTFLTPGFSKKNWYVLYEWFDIKIDGIINASLKLF